MTHFYNDLKTIGQIFIDLLTKLKKIIAFNYIRLVKKNMITSDEHLNIIIN